MIRAAALGLALMTQGALAAGPAPEPAAKTGNGPVHLPALPPSDHGYPAAILADMRARLVARQTPEAGEPAPDPTPASPDTGH
ncbi:hypothetical protein [Pseudooceanicola aestuarii]|uniref:hypothetical protein n=1 Tax=Pseudooceanicola aestuarii TaxID=2697319 RepID=UPI0013D46A4A|nr:hypothetical protein [Pseudooceanicola aestuarii]